MDMNTRDFSRSLLHFDARLLVAALCVLSALWGCGDPKQDDFQSEGGIAANPEAIFRGSIVYVGPPPSCVYEGDKPTRVIGRVILTLFEYTNPPPPEGRATGASNLFTLSGSKLFSLADCLPEGEAIDPKSKITRSVPFEWPTIPLVAGKAMDYQVRGFYDYDEDMNPFFSVKRLPTAGDIAGAAVNDITDASKGFLRVSVPSREDAKNGAIRSGITVALGNYVWTELPAFKLSPSYRKLSAEAPLVVEVDLSIAGPDVAKTVRGVFNLTCGSSNPALDCGLSLQSLKKSAVSETFAEAGVELDFDKKRYAFFLEPIDLITVEMGAPDVVKPDGEADPHPLLGSSLGVTWTTPIVLFQRRTNADTPAAAAIEAEAGIPGVALVGSPLPDETKTQRVFVDKLNLAVPPLAVVDLSPGRSTCRVPYAAPGNVTNTFEDRVAQCSDLPTGRYAVNVLHGLAGGERVKESDTDVSANGVLVEKARYAGQAWSIPNELALPEQVGDEYVLADQGQDGMFIVHDPNPTKTGNCKATLDPRMMVERPITYRGLCNAKSEKIVENLVGVDNLGCLDPTCCDAVVHLCDLPLCEVEKVDGVNVRTSPTKIVGTAENGLGIPDCVPFAMPDLCCK